jgi:[ribosomal protein S18]-alanine N-acetyltransferase
MGPISIRDMQVSDLRAVIEIERASFSMPWSESSVLDEIYSSQSLTRIAAVNESIVGYFIAKWITDEGQLLDLAVRDEYRRQGIADMLMKDLINSLKARGVVSLYLEVRATNITAISLYEKFGFAQISVRKNYYKNPDEDACIMVLGI